MEKIYEYKSTKSKRKYSLLEPFKKLKRKMNNNKNKKDDEDDDKKKKIILIIIILLVLFLVKNLTDIIKT